MKRLICWLIGHAIDPCDCYADECLRCGLKFPWNIPPRCDLGFWLSWFGLRAMSSRWYWTKCTQCKKIKGRCSCMPF